MTKYAIDGLMTATDEGKAFSVVAILEAQGWDVVYKHATGEAHEYDDNPEFTVAFWNAVDEATQ